MIAILLGITGAVCWGVADFAARFASRRIGAFRTLLYMQLIGFIALSAYLKFTGAFSHVPSGWHPWMLAVAAGLMNVTASLAFYYSFQIGTMSIVAPVSSSYPALTVALSILSGERIAPVHAAGFAVTLVGVVLAATAFKPNATTTSDRSASAESKPHLSQGVGWAIIAAILFGVMFWFLGYHVVPLVGTVVSVWVIRLTSFSALVLAAAPARQSLRLPIGSVWWLLASVGVMDTAAFVANNAGLSTGQVSAVSILASLYGAITVLLAWIVLRERLERSQWLGVALIFVGIVLVSL
jgi:drug/metabolite transporter (DMT)-like permease